MRDRPCMGQIAEIIRQILVQMRESAEARAALEVEDGYSYTATEGETTGFSNLTALSTELAR